MFIVDAVQAIGQFTATTVGAMDRDATDEELSGGIMGSGFTNFIGSLFDQSQWQLLDKMLVWLR